VQGLLDAKQATLTIPNPLLPRTDRWDLSSRRLQPARAAMAAGLQSPKEPTLVGRAG
jgi:hypothetical protein